MLRMQKYKEAITYLEHAKRLDGKNSEIELNLSYAYYRQKLYRKAIEEAQTAVELNSDDEQAQLLLTTLYVLVKEKPIAMTQYESIKTSNPKLAEKIYQVILSDKIYVIGNRWRVAAQAVDGHLWNIWIVLKTSIGNNLRRM